MKGPKFARLLLEAYLQYFAQFKGQIHVIVDTVKGDDPFLRKIAANVENNPHLQLRLNISPEAVRDFVLDDEGMRFTARFSGKDHNLNIRIENILWIMDPVTEMAHHIAWQVVEGPGGPIIAYPPESVPAAEDENESVWGTEVPEQRERPTGPPKLSVVK